MQTTPSRSRLACAALLGVLLAGSTDASAQLPGGGKPDRANPIAELQKGIGLLRTGEATAAKQHFAAMAERDPHGPMPRYYLALAHADLGAGEAALRSLREAFELGWPNPEKLASDPGFAALREKDDVFAAGMIALAAQIRRRIEEGALPGADLTAERWVDEEGAEHLLAAAKGKPLAILFLRAEEVQDQTPLWTLAMHHLEHEEDYRAVVLVECAGKGEADRLVRLTEFRQESGASLPLGLPNDSLRRSLRPWREYPTLLWIDAEGRAQVAVEGFPADLEARYAAVLDRARPEEAPGEEPASEPKKDDR